MRQLKGIKRGKLYLAHHLSIKQLPPHAGEFFKLEQKLLVIQLHQSSAFI